MEKGKEGRGEGAAPSLTRALEGEGGEGLGRWDGRDLRGFVGQACEMQSSSAEACPGPSLQAVDVRIMAYFPLHQIFFEVSLFIRHCREGQIRQPVSRRESGAVRAGSESQIWKLGKGIFRLRASTVSICKMGARLLSSWNYYMHQRK